MVQKVACANGKDLKNIKNETKLHPKFDENQYTNHARKKKQKITNHQKNDPKMNQKSKIISKIPEIHQNTLKT